ncbi:peptidoglycan-binding protein [Pikeienuella piscinae]|uniref:Peptidoglycan-binding protein n=1 Tax=Pikeienuella piscinae TaxID=2748098 RepID=A0A7L5BYN2_9RHOB|nr:peptidoglycan-binding domain-containing protein [Pikeienuella piscinae]QIE55948.1 peptidoglycan-binding protein [Pikeienuella piscinae]
MRNERRARIAPSVLSGRRPAGAVVGSLAVAMTAFLHFSPARAADADGAFAIKDAGTQTCGAFLKTWDEGNRDLSHYAGWVAGYLTGLNQFTAGAYDLAPWQSTETLLGMTRSACGQMPEETRFLDAFARLIQQMAPMRLPAPSDLEGVRRGERGFVIYEDVLAAAKRRLAAEGFDPGPAEAEFDQTASDAFLAFQKAHDLEETGLPDQKTLFKLFIQPGE